MFAFEQLVPAENSDRATLRGRHEPGARVIRDARFRPSFECDDKRLLGEVLGDANVAHHPRENGYELGLLDAENCFNCEMSVGSRHGYRLTPVPSVPQAASDHGCLRLVRMAAGFRAHLWELTDLTFALPTRHVRLVEVHETLSPFEHVGLRLRVENGVAADHLLGLGERAIGYGQLAARKSNAHAARGWQQASRLDHHAAFLGGFLREIIYSVHKGLRRSGHCSLG